MSQLKQILQGWKAYLTNDIEMSELALKRSKHCAACEHKEKTVFENILPDYSIEQIQGFKCSVCGCPLSAAIRSKDKKCPLGKW